MAIVETPDRIMTTGGSWGGDSCGGGMWILLLAFLFMFRGDGFGRDRGDGGYGGDAYKRHDAEFATLARNEWDLQKEGLMGRYETRIQALECNGRTNENIKQVDCDVRGEGEKTRAFMADLELRKTIEAQRAAIAALELKLNRKETVDETLAGVSKMLAHGCHGFAQGARWYPQYPEYPNYNLPQQQRCDRPGPGYTDFYNFEPIV